MADEGADVILWGKKADRVLEHLATLTTLTERLDAVERELARMISEEKTAPVERGPVVSVADEEGEAWIKHPRTNTSS